MTEKDQIIEAQRKHIADLRSMIRHLEEALSKVQRKK